MSIYAMSSRDIIKVLNQDGWMKVDCRGSHNMFKHPTKKGRVTVPHPKKDLPLKTMKSIFLQAQLEYGKQ